ncbi:GWxTD domain-containing protein [bacterium]|nr:GWxTD domain-containing protein [bacterium]
MKTFRVLAAIVVVHSTMAFAQIGKSAGGGPFFFMDAANFAAKDTTKGRIESFVKVAYSELLFAKYQSTLYRAQYEITYTVKDKQNNLVKREVQDREIITDKFEETTSDLRFHFSRITLLLDPGDYLLEVMITDKETQKFGQRKLDIPVKTFRDKKIGISDLIFADRIQKDSLDDIVNIVPNVFKSFDNEFKRYLVYFELYNSRFAWKYKDSSGNLPSDRDRMTLKYKILDKNQKIVLQDSTAKEVYQFQTFSSIEIDKKNLSYGKYVLDVTVSFGDQKVSSKAVFDVRLSSFTNPTLSGTGFDLDNAIKQMRHVARGANLSKIIKSSQEEKEKYFNDFWKAKDPTPETERNEIMEEYYRRIDYANRYFTSGFREGWETDRGMVFVILEAPDDIERHPYESNSKPYEIWYYYQANLKLVFVDFQGIGDYELYNRQDFENYVYLH